MLALVAIEGERSGYDLLKQVQRSIGHIWAPAKSQLYGVLRRLVEDRQAKSRRVAQSHRPDKTLYRITRAGEQTLTEWLESVEPGDAQAFYLKLFVGGLTSPKVLIAQVEQFERDTQATLAEYRAVEPTNTRRGHDYYHYLLLRLGIERAEHSLRWAEGVRRELEKRARGARK